MTSQCPDDVIGRALKVSRREGVAPGVGVPL